MEDLDRVKLLEAKQDLISKYKLRDWFVGIEIGSIGGYPGVVIKVTPQAPIEDLSWVLSGVPFCFRVISAL